PDRLESPAIRMHDVLSPVDWSIAVSEAARLAAGRRAYVVASPRLSNEALFLLKRIIAKTGGEGAFTCATGPEAPLPGVADLSLRADRAPNVTGAERLGFLRRDAGVLAGLRDGDLLILADDALQGLDLWPLTRAGAVIVIGTSLPAGIGAPNVALPIANVAEEEGTFTNLRGRVQRFLQAKAAPGLARPSWYALADLATALGSPSEDCHLPSAAFAALATAEPAFRGLSYEALGLRGAPLADATVGAA
ncbi:MAG: hypothetical protein RL625_904, partial [Gemmatimonadota bacterium]